MSRATPSGVGSGSAVAVGVGVGGTGVGVGNLPSSEVRVGATVTVMVAVAMVVTMADGRNAGRRVGVRKATAGNAGCGAVAVMEAVIAPGKFFCRGAAA